MKKALPWVFGIFVFVLLASFSLSNSSSYIKAAASHVVISQIQVAGTTNSNDEFVELYNPTDSSVDLTSWKLKKRTQPGLLTSEVNLESSISGTIASHGYFLIAPDTDYTGSVAKDDLYSTGSRIAVNNTVLLYNSTDSVAIDIVGMGTAVLKETTDAQNPSNGGSIQRKLDDTSGHGLDTNDNSTDFEALTVSDPRNSSTVISSSPSASPTATPTGTASATPTASPTSTPTNTPTSTPTSTPATASPTPTVTPTMTATPTGTPVVTMTPSPTPTSTPTSFPFPFRPLIFTCHVTYVRINTGWFVLNLPQIFCGFNL